MKIKKGLLNKRIPTILALLLLFGGLVGGVLLVSKPQSLLTKAGPTATPQNVRITNKTESSLTVSWITDTPVVGAVEYSNNPAKLEMTVRDKRDLAGGSSNVYTTHLAEIKNLVANTIYYLRIVSGSESYLNEGSPYQVKTWTRSEGVMGEDLIRGKITTTTGSGLGGAIVYVDVEGGESLASLSQSDGSWSTDLSKVKTSQGQGLGYDGQKARLSIFVQGGIAGTAMALTNTGNDNPVEDITIGGQYNFVETDLETASTAQTASASGEGFGGVSGVGLTGEELLNPEVSGEKVATSTPEFKGKLPAGTEITITVNSETKQTTVVTTDIDGEWSWTPTEELEPGDHTITLAYEDETGVLQTVMRSFVVLAAGDDDGLPAFTATPSATPTTTPSPTPTVSPATTMSSMPSTEGGVPVVGVLTQTVWLLTLGLGLFIFGFVWKKRMI